MHLVQYRRNQELLAETPPSLAHGIEIDRAAAAAIIAGARAETRDWLDEPEAKALLAAAGIPVPETRIARDPDAVAAAAAAFARPVVVKVLSPDILHKSDVGGVALDLDDPDAARAAAVAMTARVRAAMPAARLAGFTVQPMIRRRHARELIVGIADDAQFGPIVLFGQGGTAVEIIADKALALPPLNLGLAEALMRETRVSRLLDAYRDRPAASRAAVAETLVRVSQLLIDVPEIAELDINPLVADPTGVIALDARVRIAVPRRPGQSRLAIRPYPRGLESTLAAADGTRFDVRPIRPEDEPAVQAAFRRLSPEAIRLRFFSALRALPHHLAARLTQIDYEREIALAAIDPAARPPEGIVAIARIVADPDNERAEYAITVRTDMAGRGIGHALMERLIGHARARPRRDPRPRPPREHGDARARAPARLCARDRRRGPRRRPDPAPAARLILLGRVAGRFEGVAGRADGPDQIVLALAVERLAEPPDVDVDGALVDIGIVAPHRVDELVAREHPPGMLHQEPEEAELGRAERDRAAAARHLELGEIHLDVADPEPLVGDRRPRTAQHRADAGDDLGRRERLRHVVVGAGVEPAHAVALLATRRQDDDRHVPRLGPAPDLAAHLDAGQERQHPVEKHEIDRALGEDGEALLAVLRLEHLEAFLLEIIAQQRDDRRFVLDHQNDRLHD